MTESKKKSLQADDSAANDITQPDEPARPTKRDTISTTVAKVEENALKSRGKFKEFRVAFGRDDDVKGINGENPVIQRTCARIRWFCMVFIAFGIFIAGLILLTMASMRIAELQGATEGECRIQDYSTPYGTPFQPASTWRDLCSACKFMVQMRYGEAGLVNVQSWTMDFEAGFHSGKAEVVNDQFRCCPTKPALDCCNFFEEITGAFCDNFGDQVDGSCPTAPWKCYILNMDERLAEAEATGKPMPPENLKFGGLGEEQIILLVGLASCIIGFLALCCLCPCFCTIFRFLIGVKNSARIDTIYLRCAKRMPLCCRSKTMKRKIARADAAIRIQRWWKEKMIQFRKRGLLDVKQLKRDDFDVARNAEEIPTMSLEPLHNEVSKEEEEEKEQMEAWKHKNVGEQMVIANRVHKMILEAKRNPQVGISIAPPPEASYSVGKRLLYDTGNTSTSRKLGAHRVLSDPDDRLERVEVVLLDENTILDLKNALYVPYGRANDTRPRITKIPKGTALETLGLVPGHKLTKVGKLLYPTVNGAQLMQALTGTSRPVFMIFEGFSRPYENPEWAEKWQTQHEKLQKQHAPIPYENPPWARLHRAHSRKILPIEYANDYGNISNDGSQASYLHGDSRRGSLRDSANPTGLRTSNGSLLGTEFIHQYNSYHSQQSGQGSERLPLPPSATPPVMNVVNRPSQPSKLSIASSKTPQTGKSSQI